MDNSEYVGYIYCITNLITKKKYIGQTIRTIQRRWSAHKTEAKIEKNPTYLHISMLKYGFENFEVKEVEKVTCQTRDELKKQLDILETEYIKKFDTIRPNGYNITPGEYTSSYTRQRPVVQISPKGEIVKHFNSIADAGREIAGNEASSVNSVLNGYTNKAYGYYWKYEDDEGIDDFIKSLKDDFRYVAKYDLDGNLIKVYESFYDASKDSNIPVPYIRKVCNGVSWRARNYQFRDYKLDELILNKIEPISWYHGKPVNQYDMDHNFITSYRTIREATIANPSFKWGQIYKCCIGDSSSSYNYIWEYA